MTLTKVSRTFNVRLEFELNKLFDAICTRNGDITYHVENALRAYIPTVQADKPVLREFVEVKAKQPKTEPLDQSAIDRQEVHDNLFDLFWKSGIRKVNKKKTKPLFNNLLKSQEYASTFTHKLCDDIKTRLNSNQLGFAEMHPTTYLNGERWNDEVIPNGQNRPNGNTTANRLTPAESVKAKRAQRAAERERDVGSLGGNERVVSPCVDKDGGGRTNTRMGEVIDGDYTRTDHNGPE